MIKKALSQGVILILLLAFLVGGGYVYFNTKYGIEVSCLNKEILGFNRMPPPEMAVVSVEYCSTNLSVTYNNQVLCERMIKSDSEKFVIECNILKSYTGKEVTINVEFYDPDGKKIGKDKKTSKVEFK